MSNNNWLNPNNNCASQEKHHEGGICPQLPGTILRLFLPPGAVLNLLNLIEVVSPSGVCLIVRIPVLGDGNSLEGVLGAIKEAGGKVELVKE